MTFEKWWMSVRNEDWFNAYGEAGKAKLAWMESLKQAKKKSMREPCSPEAVLDKMLDGEDL